MSKIHFHHPRGSVDVLEVEPGTSIMRAAVTNGVDGIIGECGGQAMCATCHVYVREEYLEALPKIGSDEDEMLDCTAEDRTNRSRLGCQVKLTADMDEIQVDLPESQV